MEQEVTNLEQLLDRIRALAKDEDRISLDAILDAVGRRSFGPFLLVAGLVTVMPLIGDIPGIPTMMGLIVMLTAVQLLFRRDHFWLPQWLLKRSAPKDKLCKVLDWLRRPARFLDRLSRPRLSILVRGAGVYVIAVTCIIIAAATPAMEVVPFSANGAGAALTVFGLSLIAHDGLLALIALTVTVSTFGFVAYQIL